MSQTIWKYDLDAVNRQEIEVPEGAYGHGLGALHVGVQHDEPVLWRQVNPDNKKCTAVIRMFATGEKLPDERLYYLGTVHLSNGRLVLHVFVETA